MTTNEKQEFIRNLCESIAGDVIAKIDKMPEDWNGGELRELLYEKFRDARMFSDADRRDRRFRNYQNQVLVRNL